jgi:hypothetical protein
MMTIIAASDTHHRSMKPYSLISVTPFAIQRHLLEAT